VLAQPGVHVAIVGARSARNIEEQPGRADVDLSESDLAEIEKLVTEGVSIAGSSPEGVA